METTFKYLKYKGFTGTVEQREDGSFSGKVNELNAGFSYQAPSLCELEIQFKNRVANFYESCAMLGVEPEIIGRKKPLTWLYIVLGILAVLFMVGIFWFYSSEFPLSEVANQTKEKVEWFDKSSSFFNNYAAPLLSFLSVIGLLYTIYQQNRSHQLSLKELALTREELELTRKEIEKTTVANEAQAEALQQQVRDAKRAAEVQAELTQEQRTVTQIQQFEASFYALFAQHNQVLEALIKADRPAMKNPIVSYPEEKFHASIRADEQVSGYFRFLYQILKFVAINHKSNKSQDFSIKHLKSPVSEDEKRYSSLIRAMLPQSALGLLALNCMEGYESDNHYHKYFLLVQRYAMLENLNVSQTLICDQYSAYANGPNALSTIIQHYSLEAFGTNESLRSLENDLQAKIVKFVSNDIEEKHLLVSSKNGSIGEELCRRLFG